MHLTRPHLCSVEGCRRCFKTEEELKEHQTHHKVDGFQCEHCDKIFRFRYQRTRHVVRIHQNVRRKSTIGFGLFNVAGAIQQRQKGRKMMSCLREGCNFQTRMNQTERMANHVAKKHPDCPRPKKPHPCKACKRLFAFPYLLHRHEKSCKLAKTNSKRIVPIVKSVTNSNKEKVFKCSFNYFCQLNEGHFKS